MILKYDTGDIITLKKGHPCGENKWEIMRTGADIKLRCLGCDRQICIPRIDFNKRIRKSLVEDKWISIIHYKGKENNEEEIDGKFPIDEL